LILQWKIIIKWLPKPFGFEEILEELQMLGAQNVEQE
jgi:hypothetical protein